MTSFGCPSLGRPEEAEVWSRAALRRPILRQLPRPAAKSFSANKKEQPKRSRPAWRLSKWGQFSVRWRQFGGRLLSCKVDIERSWPAPVANSAEGCGCWEVARRRQEARPRPSASTRAGARAVKRRETAQKSAGEGEGAELARPFIDSTAFVCAPGCPSARVGLRRRLSAPDLRGAGAHSRPRSHLSRGRRRGWSAGAASARSGEINQLIAGKVRPSGAFRQVRRVRQVGQVRLSGCGGENLSSVCATCGSRAHSEAFKGGQGGRILSQSNLCDNSALSAAAA